MANGPSKRQDALRSIARAYDALREQGELGADDIRALLPAWRALSPAGHPGAGADTLDVNTLAAIASQSIDLVGAHALHVSAGAFRAPVRIEPAHAGGPDEGAQNEAALALLGVEPGTALALALTLSLEGAKRAHGIGASADALRAAFATPEDARAVLDALDACGGARRVTFRENDDGTASAVSRAVGDRPAFVFCAAGAFGVHDLLSPYARRLGAKLALAGRGRVRSDDDTYRGIERIAALEPDAVFERLAAEEQDGLVRCGRALVIQLDRVPESGIDARAREAAVVLKKARAAIVCVSDDLALTLALSDLHGSVRAIAVVAEATLASTPSVLQDACGTLTPVDNALTEVGVRTPPLMTLPSLHMRLGDEQPQDARSFPLVQVALRALYDGASPLAAGARMAVRTVPVGDRDALSAAVLDVLARIGAKPTSSRGRP
jgi:hypothetical protein